MNSGKTVFSQLMHALPRYEFSKYAQTVPKQQEGSRVYMLEPIPMHGLCPIEVGSKVAIGSTFHIYLPALKKMIVEKEESEKPDFTGAGRVLVVDSEVIVRDASV